MPEYSQKSKNPYATHKQPWEEESGKGNDVYSENARDTMSDNKPENTKVENTVKQEQGGNYKSSSQNMQAQKILDPAEKKSASEYDNSHYSDPKEISIVRDFLGLNKDPAVVDDAFVDAVVKYQSDNGLEEDGKIGSKTATELSRDMIDKANILGKANLGDLEFVFRLKIALQTLTGANNTSYKDYKKEIKGGTVFQKTVALLDESLLTDIKSKLSWDNFAACIELLGRSAPSYKEVANDPIVKSAILQAWFDSKPTMNASSLGGPQHEEGGWVYMNLLNGTLNVKRAPAGAGAALQLSFPAEIDDCVIVAVFHTHPNLGIDPADHQPWRAKPSGHGGDTDVDALHGVPDIVVGSPNNDTKDFNYFLSGPWKRLHLAGGKGFPGVSGGIAP